MQVSVTIARGRSVVTPVQVGTRIDVHGGGTLPVYDQKSNGPGSVILVEDHQVAGLLAGGFIVDPNALPRVSQAADDAPNPDAIQVTSTTYDRENPVGIGLRSRTVR